MKSGQLRRSATTRLKRSGIRSQSKRRGGIAKAQRADLKELCRTVVMQRAGAFLFEEGSKRQWMGECAIKHCSLGHKWLQVCHIFSQGKYPRAAFMPENCFAACWRCHLGPGGWHKEPVWAKGWIEARLGVYGLERLKLKVETAGPVDYTLTRLHLLDQAKALGSPSPK